jgi:transposase InsO family protein
MWQANPTWGSLRIVGELRKLGLNVATSTVEQDRPRVRKPSSPTWKTFLYMHVHDLVAGDFCLVSTATCRVLFVFILLAHARRRLVHCTVTEHPTAQWTAQHIVEAFPWESAPRSLLRDRDAIDSMAFHHCITHIGIEEVKIASRSPWHNPSCERLIGSIRREVLAQVIVLNDQHLGRVRTASIISYDHRFRTHLSLAMDGPHPWAVEPPEGGKVMALPEGGGLHHHDARQAA